MNAEAITTFPGLDTITLDKGAHDVRGTTLCIMEAVSWLAREPHSDSPKCTCRVIAAFARRLNDARGMTPELRKELLGPLAVRMVGTRTDDVAVMRKRAFMCADFAVRVAAPIALEARGLGEWATKLRALPEIVDTRSARAAEAMAREARRAAADAAYAAAAAAAAADDAAADAAAADAAYAAAAAAAAYAAAAAADDAAAAAAAALRVFREAAALLGRMCDVTG